ncbi:hypothetical protein [Clostridium polynesiense]|uniref:hypothetical protein n=1 Tax=Clostridium polynesiense TaxID=1325933 RepID=UPI00058CB8FC|nr:hypothetical protein [Clostridium polynesiense]
MKIDNKNLFLKKLNGEGIKELLKETNASYDITGSYEEALKDIKFYKALGIKYALLYNFDSLKLSDIEEAEIHLDNLIEGRFFSEDLELDMRIEEEGITGNIFLDRGEKQLFIEEELLLRHTQYKKLKVKRYISLDKDNQAYIFYLKPCELIKEVL